jgi:diguanylate cyclase (GGDEF)-like protein/PAS domain S-box-containing protein
VIEPHRHKQAPTKDDAGAEPRWASIGALWVRVRGTPAVLLGATVALATLGFFGWSQYSWMRDITEAERVEIEIQLEQLRRGYEAEVADLYSVVGDYALWSETAEFARGFNTEYWNEDADAAVLARLDVSDIVVLSRELIPRLSLVIDTGGKRKMPVDPELTQWIQDAAKRGALSRPNDSLQGIVGFMRGKRLVVVRPVFDNGGSGEVAGYAMFARELSDRTVSRIARFSPWPSSGLVVGAVSETALPPQAAAWISQRVVQDRAWQNESSDTVAEGMLGLTDVNGAPAWLLQVSLPRTAYQKAERTAKTQGAILLLLFTVFGGFAALWTRRWRKFNADRAAMENRYRAIIEQADEGVLIVNASTLLIQEANESLQRLSGLSLEQLRGMTLQDVLGDAPGSEPEALASLLRGRAPRGLELALSTADGSTRPVEVSCSEVEMSEQNLYALVVRDLSLRKKAESQLLAKQKHLDRLAHHDQLTGLPNRLFLQAHLPEAIERATAEKRLLAVLFLDLDRFKHINDSRGHEVGDKLLQEIAKRVRAAVRPDDVVVRMGGDEFVVVLHGARTHDEVNNAASRINDVLGAPVVIDGRALVATVSIGVSVFPRDGASMGELLKHSDTAMYQAKDRGRNNFQVFSPLMDQRIKERVAIESNLRAALRLQQFDVHYQPILDITTRRVAGMEALLRWKHPSHGYISPVRFIDVAEETGLIIPIGHFVLHRVAQDLAKWRAQGLNLTPVAINISAVQLERTNLRELIQRALTQYNLGPEWLQLELTEGSLFEKRTGESRDDALEQLRELGVKIAIDDFGTGYSSLSYLKRWRVDTLKIDRGFIRDIATDQSDAAIVGAIVAMARNLNIKVVAEGIEGWQQLELLRSMGCHLAQGFLFAKPVPAAEAVRFLQTLQVDILAEANAESLADTGT